MKRVVFLLLPLIYLSPIFAEEIHFIDPNHPQAVWVNVSVSTDENAETFPACLTLIPEDGQGLWGKDVLGKQLRYQGTPRIWISEDTVLCVTAGEYEITCSRPYEYKSFTYSENFLAGQTHHISMHSLNSYSVTDVHSRLDMRAQGWYAGDAHQHILHGEREFAVDPALACRIAQAEGADWCFFNTGYTSVSGQNLSIEEAREIFEHESNDRFAAFAGDEYPKDHLGHMVCLPGEVKNWIEEIGINEYEPAEGEREELAHFEILNALAKKGGIGIYTHPIREYGGTPQSPSNLARELPFDLLCAPELVHTVDWMTDRPHDPRAMQLWSMYLNWGYKIGLCAFSDTCYDRGDARPLIKRTYAYLGDKPMTNENLTEAIRNGHTFGTTGPLIVATLDGQVCGNTIPSDNKRHILQIKAYAPGVDYMDRRERYSLQRIEIIRNGEVMDIIPMKEGTDYFEDTIEIYEHFHAWYVIKVFAQNEDQVAITSPFYFQAKSYNTLLEPPKPIEEWIKVKIVDTSTGKPLAGRIEILEYHKDDSVILGEESVEQSGGEILCRMTARLRANADGYQPQTKSLFFDTPIYDQFIWPARRNDLLNPEYYEKLKEALFNLELTFELEAENDEE